MSSSAVSRYVLTFQLSNWVLDFKKDETTSIPTVVCCLNVLSARAHSIDSCINCCIWAAGCEAEEMATHCSKSSFYGNSS
jgi:hypothetical protein